uniref:Uncharacterized protein n=1 Tax=Trepomonas sp. PC1 TaxID=1076344 RepID=A0A146KBB1_9EUKA|eukprot:JAP94093.1 hypothetical protein TPC1_13376 [Trepomonas sp. PC1]
MMIQQQPIIANSLSLARYKLSNGTQEQYFSLGSGDQYQTCSCAHPQEPVVASFMWGKQPQIILTNTASTTQFVTLKWAFGQVDNMIFSADGSVLICCVRASPAIVFIGYEGQTLQFLTAITDFLPYNAPFNPKYLQAHDDKILMEVAMRGFLLTINKQAKEDIQKGDLSFSVSPQMIYVPQLVAASTAAFCFYKDLKFIVAGYPDSFLRMILITEEDNLQQYPFPTTFNVEGEYSQQQTFAKTLLVNPNLKFTEVNKLFLPKLTPKEAPQPKFGITSITCNQLEIIVGCRGGMLLKFQFVSQLKIQQKKEEFNDSDQESVEDEVKEDMPGVELKSTYNLSINEFILQQIGANAPKSSAEYITQQQEESNAWSDSRAQIEILNIILNGDIVFFTMFDPVTLQCVVVYYQLSTASYTIQQQLTAVNRSFVSIITTVYYQQISALAQIIQKVLELYSTQTTSKKLSLLQIAQGQLTEQANQNPLLENQIPSSVNSALLQVTPFKSTCSKIKQSRFVVATREGQIMLFDIGFQLLAQARLIDAILKVELNETADEILITCTDTVRIFKQNGKFLNQIKELGIKMAQIIQIGRGVTILGSGGRIYILNNISKEIIQQFDAHNTQIQAITFLQNQEMYATCDQKGMLQIWRIGQEKTVDEFNCRGDITSLCEYRIMNPAAQYDEAKQKLYLTAVIDGVIQLFNISDKKIIFKGVLVNDAKLVASRVVEVYNEEKFLMSDSNGALWSCILPFDQIFASLAAQMAAQQQQTVINPNLIAFVYGRPVGRFSHQLNLQQPEINHKDPVEVTKIKSETALQFTFSADFQYLICQSTQQAGQITVLKTDEVAAPAKFKPLLTVDFQLLQKLILIQSTLEKKLIDAQLDFDHQIKVQQQNNEQKIEMQKGQAEQEVKNQTVKIKSFMRQAEEEAELLEKKLQELDRINSDELQKVENKFRDEVQKIQQQKLEIQQEIDQFQNMHVQQLIQMRNLFQKQTDEMHLQKDKQQKRLQVEYNECEQETENLTKQFNEMQDTADSDADVQMQEQVSRSLKELEVKKIQIQTYTAETGMIRNKFGSIRKQTLAFVSNLNACENQIIQQQMQLKQLEAQLQEKEKEKEIRKQAITESEEKIYERKQTAKELEKHRFVLDFKIKDLRKLIQPREQEIHDLQEQTKDLGAELEMYHKEIQQVSQNITDFKAEEAQLKVALSQQKQMDINQKNKLAKLEHEIGRIIEDHGHMDYQQLKACCLNLQEFGGKEFMDQEKMKADQEKNLHKQFLYDAAQQLAEQLNSEKDAILQENQKIVEENTELLKEAAVLRREIQKIVQQPVSQNSTESQKVFQMRITAQEAEIKRLKKRQKDLEEMQEDL